MQNNFINKLIKLIFEVLNPNFEALNPIFGVLNLKDELQTIINDIYKFNNNVKYSINELINLINEVYKLIDEMFDLNHIKIKRFLQPFLLQPQRVWAAITSQNSLSFLFTKILYLRVSLKMW